MGKRRLNDTAPEDGVAFLIQYLHFVHRISRKTALITPVTTDPFLLLGQV